MEKMQDAAPLMGRMLLAHVFIVAAILKLSNFSGTAAFMSSVGVPAAPLLLAASLPIELAGGLMIVVGWKARWAAAALAVWLVVVTPLFHAFWGLEPARMADQLNHFMKNASILGGLLLVVAKGAGSLSVDERRARARQREAVLMPANGMGR